MVITKSMKDVMFLYEHGIPAIAPNSEGIIISDKQMQKLSKRFTKIIVFYDKGHINIKKHLVMFLVFS